MDKPADYGSAFRGSNPLGGTYSPKAVLWTAFGIFTISIEFYIYVALNKFKNK